MPVFKTGAIDHSTTPPSVCGDRGCLLSPAWAGFGKFGVKKKRESAGFFKKIEIRLSTKDKNVRSIFNSAIE